jgi:hypothetical protein
MLHVTGRAPWRADPSIARTTRTDEQKEWGQASEPRLEFKPTILVSELSKTLRALYRLSSIIQFILILILQ